MQIVLGLLWLVSFTGHLWFWIEKRGVAPAMAPLAAMSCIVLFVFAGALAHVMIAVELVLLAAGLVCVLWMIRLKSRVLWHADLLVFVFAWAAMALRYSQSLLIAYDDYSHWGMIVRHLLSHGRLPGPQDVLISFQSYPPGAALWADYMCRFTGRSDGTMLAAQAGLVLAGWMPLFELAGGCASAVRRLSAAVMTVIGLSLFQGTASMMVDNLIAALAVGALGMMVHQRREPHAWLVGMVLALLAISKDSGLFFAGILALVYAFFHWKKAGLRVWIPVGLPVVATRAAWFAHIKLAFPAADTSRHALTLENMRAMGADKSYADIFEIGRRVASQAVDPANQAVQILLIMTFAAAVICLICKIRDGRFAAWDAAVPAASAAVYAAWLASMWLMYAFNMELSGAMELVAFQRYNSTCALFLYGALAVWLMEKSRDDMLCTVLTVLCVLFPLLIGSWTAGIPRFFQENYFVPIRSCMEELANRRPLRAGESALVLINREESASYAEFMARYVFQSPDVKVVYADDAASAPAANVCYLTEGVEQLEETNEAKYEIVF